MVRFLDFRRFPGSCCNLDKIQESLRVCHLQQWIPYRTTCNGFHTAPLTMSALFIHLPKSLLVRACKRPEPTMATLQWLEAKPVPPTTSLVLRVRNVSMSLNNSSKDQQCIDSDNHSQVVVVFAGLFLFLVGCVWVLGLVCFCWFWGFFFLLIFNSQIVIWNLQFYL